jgi:hypothetical protein
MIDRAMNMPYNSVSLGYRTDSEHSTVSHPCVLSKHYPDGWRLNALEESMKEISLTRGKVALVDDEDFEWLNQWNWCYRTPKSGKNAMGYAIRMTQKDHVRTRIHMHRLIMNTPPELEVDHINGNRIDNQKSNLRNCTHQQNIFNKTNLWNNTSGYRGVSLYYSKYWVARITINVKISHIGTYKTAEEAAHAYDIKAVKCFGEFAGLNFPEEWINRDKEYEE